MASITRVEATNPRGAIDALEKDGAVILVNFTNVDDVSTVNSDVLKMWTNTNDLDFNFYPGLVRMSFTPFGRSQIFRERWVMNEHFQTICKHFLRTETTPYFGSATDLHVNDPILSTSLSVNILPGAGAQQLHRDDMTWQKQHVDRSAGYTPDAELCIGMLVPGVDFTESNGATKVILGSHVWPHSKRGKPEDTVTAAMTRGEVLLILGSVVHGGGANTTQTNRILHSAFVCRAYLRQENNMMHLFPREEVETWSPEAQYMGGYKMGSLFLGHSDGEDPLQLMAKQPHSVKA